MSTEEQPFNKYRFAIECLTPKLVELGGEMLAETFSNDQLEYLRENDPVTAKSNEFLMIMLGSMKTGLPSAFEKYIALGEIIRGLAVQEQELDGQRDLSES